MGAVYLAEDTRLHRKVALKVLPAEMASNADRLARFEREAHAVAALNHPHIVTIYSVEEAGGTHFLTMELAEGTSLEMALPPGGLPLTKVFDIGIALAEALAAAHDKGVVHRDLKPANVMLAPDGRIKVLDFGLAKLTPGGAAEGAAGGAARRADLGDLPTVVTGERSPGRALTDAGMVVGTAPYMSPEQVNGLAVDARTDIFSLGVMLYELATGRRPFAGNTRAETISSILRDTPRPVSECRQDAPRHLVRIIDHCLQKDPEARFQSAKDVRNELRALRKEVESGAPEQVAPTVSEATPAASPRSRLWVVAGAALVLAVAGAFWIAGRRSGPAGAAAPGTVGTAAGAAGRTAAGAGAVAETNSLAVLPFTNMSPDKDQEYFSDGLTEELLNALVKIPDLKVTGRTSSFSFKGKNEDLRTIAEKLGVANILEGSVRKSGNKVRITAQLVKASDGFHLWSETYDRTLDDIFAVQDDIARAVAQALQVTLLGQPANAKRPDAEAYDLILQAHYVLQINTEERVRSARAMLERALQLSPDYAPAWAEIGLTHVRDSERSTRIEQSRPALQRAREAFTRALQLDPNLAAAHSRMAVIQASTWEFAEAERSTAKALAADPKNPSIVGNAAIVSADLGRITEAIRLTEQALGIDPLSPVRNVNLGNFYTVAGRLDDAEAQYRKAIELRPDNPALHQGLGINQLLSGRTEAARASFKRYDELSGLGDYGRLRYEPLLEHSAGNEPASKAAAEEFEKRFGAEDSLAAADIRAWRNEPDRAFAWLEKSFARRDPGLSGLNGDVVLNSLHSDPRWNALLKKIGLPTDPVR